MPGGGWEQEAALRNLMEVKDHIRRLNNDFWRFLGIST